MKKYKVCARTDRDDLEVEVNAALAEGWELQGGVAYGGYVFTYENQRKGYMETEVNTMFVQVIVKEEPE